MIYVPVLERMGVAAQSEDGFLRSPIASQTPPPREVRLTCVAKSGLFEIPGEDCPNLIPHSQQVFDLRQNLPV
jgi:hypothetical protein